MRSTLGSSPNSIRAACKMWAVWSHEAVALSEKKMQVSLTLPCLVEHIDRTWHATDRWMCISRLLFHATHFARVYILAYGYEYALAPNCSHASVHISVQCVLLWLATCLLLYLHITVLAEVIRDNAHPTSRNTLARPFHIFCESFARRVVVYLFCTSNSDYNGIREYPVAIVDHYRR